MRTPSSGSRFKPRLPAGRAARPRCRLPPPRAPRRASRARGRVDPARARHRRVSPARRRIQVPAGSGSRAARVESAARRRAPSGGFECAGVPVLDQQVSGERELAQTRRLHVDASRTPQARRRRSRARACLRAGARAAGWHRGRAAVKLGFAMKLYDELAEWWPLFSPPGDDYAEEAAYVRGLFDEAGGGRVRTLLDSARAAATTRPT